MRLPTILPGPLLPPPGVLWALAAVLAIQLWAALPVYEVSHYDRSTWAGVYSEGGPTCPTACSSRRTGIPRGITHSCFRWMEPGKGGDNQKQLSQCTAGRICDEVQHQHPCFILTLQSPTSLKWVEMLYIENHRVYGLDPADPIRVTYGTPLREELIARERPDRVRMPVDSQSLLPVLLGAPGAEARRELVLQRMGHLALSQGGWLSVPANRPPGTKRPTAAKLAETVLGKTHRYRLAADPSGNHNLPASYREQVAALAEAVAAYA